MSVKFEEAINILQRGLPEFDITGSKFGAAEMDRLAPLIKSSKGLVYAHIEVNEFPTGYDNLAQFLADSFKASDNKNVMWTNPMNQVTREICVTNLNVAADLITLLHERFTKGESFSKSECEMIRDRLPSIYARRDRGGDKLPELTADGLEKIIDYASDIARNQGVHLRALIAPELRPKTFVEKILAQQFGSQTRIIPPLKKEELLPAKPKVSPHEIRERLKKKSGVSVAGQGGGV